MPRKRAATDVQTAGSTPEPLDFSRPFQQLRPETFYRFTREYPNQEAVATYVYRLLPKINRAQVGIKTNYIAIHTEPVDEAMLLQAHGSGFYMLKFTDSNQPKGITQRATTKLELSDPDFPPVVDPRELVLDDEKSRPWLDDLRARGVLKGEHVSGATNESPAVDALADVTKKLLEDRGKEAQLGNQLTPIILEIIKRNPMKEAFEIADRLKPAESPLTAKMLELLIAQRATPAPAASDPFETYERIEKLLDKVASKSGGGKSSGWSEFLQAAPGLLQSGLNLMTTILALRGGQQPPPPAPVAAPRQEQVAPVDAENILPPGDVDMMNPATIRALQTTGEKAIKAFERGISGEHFAAALTVDEEGEKLYDMLFDLGKDGILQALSMVPGLSERLAPRRAEIEVWLESFIRYGAEEGEEAAK